MESNFVQILPKGQLLIVDRPDEIGVKSRNGFLLVSNHILQTTLAEDNTRIILYTDVISVDEQQKSIFIEPSK